LFLFYISLDFTF